MIEIPNVTMYVPTSCGGHARYANELLCALATMKGSGPKASVSLVTSADLDARYRETPYPIHTILPPIIPRDQYQSVMSWGGSRLLHYSRRERTFLRWLKTQDDVDAVHIQEYTPWLASRDFASIRAMGKKVFATVHNVRPHQYPAGIPVRLWDGWNRAAWRQCDTLFVHSSGLVSELSEFLRPGHPDIVVIPHGIWSHQSVVDDGKRFPSGKLLFYGMIRRSKGLETLLEALQHLPACSLTVAGMPESPGYRDEIRHKVSRLPEERITLHDEFVPDEEVPGFFAEADLVVLPYSSFSSQSGVLHDAIAFGRPVVVTDVGALGESVRQWGIGQVARSDDAADLARAISAALEPKFYLAACKALGKLRDDLTWTKAAQITFDTYRRVWRHG
jgi:glycosyltransferase involved in cell wall biosynthesis